nr:unnamed protein product [Digitaria exilis]
MPPRPHQIWEEEGPRWRRRASHRKLHLQEPLRAESSTCTRSCRRAHTISGRRRGRGGGAVARRLGLRTPLRLGLRTPTR